MAAAAPDSADSAPGAKRSLRLWLRMLACASTIEGLLAARLRDEFGSTLPRFDVLSALERAEPEGLSLGEVSRRLMVTQGNVTGLASRLKSDGLIEPCASADRRVQRVRLTDEGRARFARMAAAHERWVDALLADLTAGEADQLIHLLDRARRSLQVTTPEELQA